MQQTIQKANEKIRGKRTYAVSIGFIVIGSIGWIIGAVDGPQAIEWILEGFGFSGLRAALANRYL